MIFILLGTIYTLGMSTAATVAAVYLYHTHPLLAFLPFVAAIFAIVFGLPALADYLEE